MTEVVDRLLCNSLEFSDCASRPRIIDVAEIISKHRDDETEHCANERCENCFLRGAARIREDSGARSLEYCNDRSVTKLFIAGAIVFHRERSVELLSHVDVALKPVPLQSESS